MVARQAMPILASARGKTDRDIDVGNTRKPSRHNYYATDWTGVRTLTETRLPVLFQIGPEASPASCKTGTGSIAWGKAAGSCRLAMK